MESTPEDGAIIEWNIKEFKDLEEDIIQVRIEELSGSWESW